jgi:D-alanyl-D-alanine carboxypeptidase (penicillin-binding protein 5/6)
MNRNKEVIIVLILSFSFMGISLFLTKQNDPLKLASYLNNPDQAEENLITEQDKIAIAKKRFLTNLNLEARAYVIYNPETKEIIASSDENRVLSLASLTKVMTVLVASERLGPEANIDIREDIGENSSGFFGGERWQMANLSALTLVSSSNEGATALAEAATESENLVLLMNKKAQDLNLTSLKFSNPTGLDDGPQLGGQGSAIEVAKLFAYVLDNKPEILEPTREAMVVERSTDGLDHTVFNTNTIVNQIPGLIASKTGFTDLAGGNLAIAANIGLRRPLIFVVLGSSKEGRFSDTKKLTEASLNYYAYINK